ncbi:DinB family protein [Bacillus sp. EB01]|uniref:DinB family protein n=1 Tax=Bacillus sp. EB01 TaxID=1347086 RepID=UPI0005C5036F|nr:DinB family protein [Bacillus sp. EB01]
MLSQLKSIREDLMQCIMEFTEEQFNQKPAEDRWSAAQVAHHLYSIEKQAVEILKKAESETVEERDFSLITDRSEKVRTKNEPPEEFMEKQDVCALLLESRESLEQLVDEIGEDSLKTKSAEHPRFGRMSLKNYVECLGFHEKRHIAQIEEIKSELL